MYAYLFTKTLTIGAAITMLSSAAHAKDWIHKVDIAKRGVDTRKVEVAANAKGYTKMKTSKHRFGLGVYARAKRGKRIGMMKIYTAAGINKKTSWRYTLPFKTIGSGTRKRVRRSIRPEIPTSRVTWHKSPVAACNLLKYRKMSNGMSKHAVLSKAWNVTAKAKFHVVAYAEKPKYARKSGLSFLNRHSYTSKAVEMIYPVKVRCLSGLDPETKSSASRKKVRPAKSYRKFAKRRDIKKRSKQRHVKIAKRDDIKTRSKQRHVKIAKRHDIKTRSKQRHAKIAKRGDIRAKGHGIRESSKHGDVKTAKMSHAKPSTRLDKSKSRRPVRPAPIQN